MVLLGSIHPAVLISVMSYDTTMVYDPTNCISLYLNNKRICIHLCSGITPELSTPLSTLWLSSNHHPRTFFRTVDHVSFRGFPACLPSKQFRDWAVDRDNHPKKPKKHPRTLWQYLSLDLPFPILIVTWSSAVLNTAPILLSLQHHQLKPDFVDGFNGLQPHHSFLY